LIDFAAIAAAFQAGFASQTHGWPVLFDKLDKLVEQLDDKAGDTERATRAYPVLRYRDGALSVRLALGPAPLLVDPDRQALSLGAGISAGVDRFAAGLGQVRDAVDAELALPRLVGDLAGMVAAVEASQLRFDQATPAMFGDDRRFSDVFGLATLTLRALQGRKNQDQLRAAASQAGGAVGFLRSLAGPAAGAGAPAPAASPAAAAGPLTQMIITLESASVLAMDAIFLLPVAGLALDVLLTEGVLAVETAALSEFSQLEQSIYQFRQAVVDAWLEAFDLGSALHLFTAAADFVVRANTELLSGMFPAWLDSTLDGVQMFGYGIGLWGMWAEAVATTFEAASDDLMAVDLMPWIVRNTLSGWVADHVPMPALTLGALVALLTGDTLVGRPLRDELDDFFDNVDDVLRAADLVIDVKDMREKAAALASILHITLTPTPFRYPPDVLPSGPLAGFPGAYQDFLGGTARADLMAAVQSTGTALQGGVHASLTSGAELSAGLAAAARDELDRQARFGAGLGLGQRSEAEGALVHGLFAPLRADVSRRAETEPADPFAQAFDQAVRTGGIAAAAAAIPAYVGELRRFWAARTVSRKYPTSAHLLARRGRLAAVRVPRLTMNAPGRAPGTPLAAETADAFRGAVRDAYWDGRDRMAVLAGGGEPDG
jgi:hypothetical protein